MVSGHSAQVEASDIPQSSAADARLWSAGLGTVDFSSTDALDLFADRRSSLARLSSLVHRSLVLVSSLALPICGGLLTIHIRTIHLHILTTLTIITQRSSLRRAAATIAATQTWP